MAQGKELYEKYLASEKNLNDGIRVEGGHVVLLWGGCEYNIEEGRLETERALLGWVYHLSEKAWMDCSKIRKFIAVVRELKGFGQFNL